MAKHFDLTNILTNEKPTITFCGQVFTVNDEKTNVILLNKELDELKGSLIDATELAIHRLLGEEQKAKLDALSLSYSAYQELFYVLLACVNNEEIETVKARFQKLLQNGALV